jgi:multiple sugar transport system permease protein
LGVETASAVLSALLIVWTLVPLYNMVRVALQEKEDVFSSSVIPETPTLHSFWTVFKESYWLLANFWGQMANLPR